MKRSKVLFVIFLWIGGMIWAQDIKKDQIAKAFKAVRNNDIATLQALIQDKETLNAIDLGNGFSLLHTAVNTGKADIVKILLAAGIDIERKSEYGADTPLLLACERGNQTIFRMLIDKGATLASPERLVLAAAAGGNMAIVKYLVENDLPLDVQDRDGISPLHCALQSGNREIVEFLLKKERRLGNRPFLIHSAAYGGKVDLVDFCIKLGQSIDSQDIRGWTPLHIAVFEKNLNLVRFLIKKGASLNIKSKQAYERHEDHVVFLDGFTPLYFAVLNNDTPITDLIIKKIGKKDFNREVVSLYYLARIYGYADLSKHLVSSCSNINIGNEHGWTLLHQAVYLDADEETIGMILKRGGNRQAKTRELFKDYLNREFSAGSTAEDIARVVGSRNLAKALMRRGIRADEPREYKLGLKGKSYSIDVCQDGSVRFLIPTGTVFYTDGVERTWKSFSFAENNRIFSQAYASIHYFDNQRAVILGNIFENGKSVVRLTEDRGRTWSSVPFGGLTWIYDIFSNGKGEAWMGGSSGEIFYTSNGGRQWEKRNSPFNHQTRLNCIFMIDSNSGIAGALQDALCITGDNWQTFENIPTPFGQRSGDFPKISYTDNRFLRVAQWGRFYIVNQRGKVFYSLLDRINWRSFSEELRCFSVDPVSLRCFAVTNERKVVELAAYGDDIQIRKWTWPLLQALPIDIKALGSFLYILDEDFYIYRISDKEFFKRPIMVEKQD